MNIYNTSMPKSYIIEQGTALYRYRWEKGQRLIKIGEFHASKDAFLNGCTLYNYPPTPLIITVQNLLKHEKQNYLTK